MAFMLLICLDWVAACGSASILSETESLAAYRNIIARQAALEKYWLSLSGAIAVVEQASNDPKPIATKIFLKVQNECYQKIALTKYEGLAHWVPYADLWIRNDQYFAELFRAKIYPSDPFEIVQWRLRNVNQPPNRDDFQNYYLCRTHREAVLSSGLGYWRWSYLLTDSAKNFHSIKKINSRTGVCYFIRFSSAAPGLPIKSGRIDWTQTLVGAVQDGWLIYDTRLNAIVAMNVHLLTEEGYHYFQTEKVKYRGQDSLLGPLHRESSRQLLSAEGKAPRVPQINYSACDYDLSLISYPAETFTLTALGFDEPEGLQTYNKFRGMSLQIVEADPVPRAAQTPAPVTVNWQIIFISTGAALVVVTGGLGGYFFRKRKNLTPGKSQQLTWAVD